MTLRGMTTAEMQAEARRLIAEMLAQGEAGALDRATYEALKVGLRARLRGGKQSGKEAPHTAA